MKKTKIFLWTTLVTILSVVYLTIVPNFRTLANSQEVLPINAAEGQSITNATIQILVFPTATLEAFDLQVGQGLSIEEMLARGKSELHYGLGLGTLVEHHGKTLLYTHDHWGDLDRLGMVQFRSAAGDLLLELDGEAFKDMIQYRDGGTLILGAAEENGASDYIAALLWTAQTRYNQVLTPASFGTTENMQEGQIVTVARQGRDDQEVELIQATVESIITRWGAQVFKLRSLSGKTIIPGDSGGGIWLNGLLVGNMWKTNYTYRVNWNTLKLEKGYKETSFAAELLQNVDEVVESLEASVVDVEMAPGTGATSEQEF